MDSSKEARAGQPWGCSQVFERQLCLSFWEVPVDGWGLATAEATVLVRIQNSIWGGRWWLDKMESPWSNQCLSTSPISHPVPTSQGLQLPQTPVKVFGPNSLFWGPYPWLCVAQAYFNIFLFSHLSLVFLPIFSPGLVFISWADCWHDLHSRVILTSAGPSALSWITLLQLSTATCKWQPFNKYFDKMPSSEVIARMGLHLRCMLFIKVPTSTFLWS